MRIEEECLGERRTGKDTIGVEREKKRARIKKMIWKKRLGWKRNAQEKKMGKN